MKESRCNFSVLKPLKRNLGGNKSDIRLIYAKPMLDNFLIDKTKCYYPCDAVSLSLNYLHPTYSL